MTHCGSRDQSYLFKVIMKIRHCIFYCVAILICTNSAQASFRPRPYKVRVNEAQLKLFSLAEIPVGGANNGSSAFSPGGNKVYFGQHIGTGGYLIIASKRDQGSGLCLSELYCFIHMC
jgi:hypothetical protein